MTRQLGSINAQQANALVSAAYGIAISDRAAAYRFGVSHHCGLV